MNIAIVTGASSGMGSEFVFAISKEFILDEIWVISRNKDALEALQEKCDTKLRILPLDLTQETSLETYKSLLEAEKPDVKLLVNNAGYGLFGEFESMELSNQLGIIDLNDKALTAMCYLSLPYIKAGGNIINMGSNSAWQPVPYMSIYGASKAFVLSFSRAFGRELKSKDIHVMCVCPGWVKTNFFNRAVHDNTIKYFDRWYKPEDVVKKAIKDLKKKKSVSILGFPVRFQTLFLVKLLPTNFVMNTWCKQQGK